MIKVVGIIAAVCILLVGCQKSSETTAQQGQFNVEKLFTHEGCTVYRFFDDRTVYYTNCQGNTQYSCGKNCVANTETTTSFPR